jgi:ferritin-like metal-binding protein YciE
MPVKTPKDMFLTLLSDVRQGTDRITKFFEETLQFVQDPEIKQAWEARIYVNKQVLNKLDYCFELIGEQPVKLTGRLYEVFADDFRREIMEIQSPVARHMFILAKASHLTHFRIAEYKTLIAAADLAGNYGVGVLLETCLADKLAFVERNTRLIHKIVEAKVGEKMAARSAA